MATIDESYNIKRYIRYVFVRNLRRLSDSCGEDNAEYRFYSDLAIYIKEWFGAHQLYYKYLTGKISGERVKRIVGITDDRTFYRFFERQRKSFIRDIMDKENELSEKYQVFLEDDDEQTKTEKENI